MTRLHTPRRVRPPWHLHALLAALVLVSTPLRALAEPPEDTTDERYLRENFSKLEGAVGPPLCKGDWCVVTVMRCCGGGVPSYGIFLRDPKGNVTEVPYNGLGEPPEYVLDDQGRLKVDPRSNPWRSVQEEEPEGNTSAPSEKQLQAALAACREASPSCAAQFVTTEGRCNRRGCVLSVSSGSGTPACFVWQAVGSDELDLIGLYAAGPGYDGPHPWLSTRAVGVKGATCKNNCPMEVTALLRDRLRRPAEPGEIPESALSWADTSLITPIEAYRLRHVTYGVLDWNGPLDAAVRWQLALLPDHVQVKATVVDDVLELQPCASGKRPAVRCDHLELVAEDGPARGAMAAVLLLPGGRARVERWREPGGKDVQQPLEAGRCSWTRLEKGQVRGAANELVIQCDVPRNALWAGGSSRALSLRYSDAEEGRQQSLVSVTQNFRASTEYPSPFVPKVEQCSSPR